MSNKIIVLGLGPDDVRLMTIKARDILHSGKKIVLRTKICGAAQYLTKHEISFRTFDEVYESSEDFFEMEQEIANRLVKLANEEEIIYAVPGSGVYDDGTVDKLCQTYGNIEVIPGVSYNTDMLSKKMPETSSQGISIVPASIFYDGLICPRLPLSITGLDDEYTLSEIKILLSKFYGDEHVVKLYTKDSIKNMFVYEIDRGNIVDHTSSLYVPPKVDNVKYDFYDVVQVFKKLRSPEGCPWDREQTHLSLKRYLIEECAEVLDTIDDNNMEALSDELGDILLQILFHSTIAQERGDFDVYDVIYNLCSKLIERHPHVFAEGTASSSDEVIEKWDDIKKKKRGNKSEAEIMKKIPRNLNALIRAQKVQERAKKVGFDWDDAYGAFDKVQEELDETLFEYKNGKLKEAKEEVGDLLFAVINLCRLIDVLSEFALNATTSKFVNRFEIMERDIVSEGKDFSELSLGEMDKYWESAKNKIKQK